MFGDRVRRAAQHGEQARRRRGDNEPGAATLDPAGHEQARRAHVREQVYVERRGPVGLGGVEAVATVDAGIGEPDVDLAQVLARGRDQGRHALFRRGVAGRGVPADRLGDLRGRARVQVVHDNRAPPAAIRVASARPMPCPAPVTTTPWPDSGPLIRRRR